jgi:lipoprotein-releasing system ATP-binding protein
LDNEPVYRTADLTKSYRSGSTDLTVFSELSIEVARGEKVAIIGESGAGKSTLLHLLGGLDRPTRGRIYFGPREITALSDWELANYRNREIGFVWQVHHLLPEFTAIENVMMPLLIRGTSTEQAHAPALAILREVGLGERTHHRAGELSGGEQQRVALARALVAGPRVLLADEPTGNLDYRTGAQVMDLLDQIHAAHELTSVIVTHNREHARRCDRVFKLEKGTLVLSTGRESLERMEEKTDGNQYV